MLPFIIIGPPTGFVEGTTGTFLDPPSAFVSGGKIRINLSTRSRGSLSTSSTLASAVELGLSNDVFTPSLLMVTEGAKDIMGPEGSTDAGEGDGFEGERTRMEGRRDGLARS